MALAPAGQLASAAVHAAAALGLLAASCGAPQLQVDIEVPAPYRDYVVKIVLEVLLPPPGNDFGCEELAWAAVSTETLAYSRAVQIEIGPGEEGRLAGIDRRSPKLLVAEGYDAAGATLVRGCAALGAIERDTRARVITQPAVLLDLPELELTQPLRIGPGEPLSVEALVQDAHGAALAGVPVRVSLRGAGATKSQTEMESGSDGIVALPVMAPEAAGPFVLDVRAPLQNNDPIAVPGTVFPEEVWPDIEIPLPGIAAPPIRIGNVGPDGRGAIAFLIGTTLHVVSVDPSAQPASTAHATLELGARPVEAIAIVPRGGAEALWLLRSPAGDPSRAVEAVAVDAAGAALVPLGSILPPAAAGAARSVFWVSACSSSDPAAGSVLVLFEPTSAGSQLMAAGYRADTGARADNPFASITLDASNRVEAVGCAADSAGTAYPTLIYPAPSSDPQLALFPTRLFVAPPTGGLANGQSTLMPFGISIPRSLGAGPHGLVAWLPGADVIRFGRFSLDMGGPQAQLEASVLHPAPAPLLQTGSGDVDGDGRPDLVGIYFAAVLTFRVYLALGAPEGEPALLGFLAGDIDLQNAVLGIADLDGDAIDDIIVAGTRRSGSADTLFVKLIRMGPHGS